MQKFFSSVKQTNLNREAVIRAWEFARRVTPTVNYADANQHQTKKILDDHFVSKLGEEACANILQEFATVSGPDYAIYTGKEKNWKADLLINNTGVAVKTQRRTNAQKYGLSWTFQCSPTRRDTILDDENAWVVFVEYDDTQPYNCFVFPPFKIKELIFSEPRLMHLKDKKKVVYAVDLKL